MSDEVKAREFWINLLSTDGTAVVAQVGETRLWKGIHVIEFDAYRALDEELAAERSMVNHLKGNLNLMRNERDYFEGGHDTLKAERDQLVKELQELKEKLNDKSR